MGKKIFKIKKMHYFFRDPICENDSALLVQFFNKYIKLILVVDPKSGVQELKSHSDLYDLEEVLKIARDCNHEEAQAFLLEKCGNYQEAFEVST